MKNRGDALSMRHPCYFVCIRENVYGRFTHLQVGRGVKALKCNKRQYMEQLCCINNYHRTGGIVYEKGV